MDESSKVQVAVRLRPMNKRELDLGTKCVVDMSDNQTILYHRESVFGQSAKKGSHIKHQPKTFAFDHCFWSMDEKNTAKYHGQDSVFEGLGTSLLQNAFAGYNACIFAYGQTGSGKSYTMMGTQEQKGIIPLLCDALFEKIMADDQAGEQSNTVEVSYMEIYNEKVHDLLDPNSKGNLKVREHKILGPYVDGLSQLAVKSFADIESLMVEGNKSRTVAATNMNSESSRSHAVFTIKLTQTLSDKASGVSGERVSKMSLVDLAGSERVTKTGAIGERLKEGSNINKSLTTLGLVIKSLAEQSSGGKAKNKFVPYRDSVLTWLLKDNLGGNSKTVMIATISPAADNYEETLSTLRYADSAKRIVNHAVVNEDPNARAVRELRQEVDALRQQLQAAESMKAPDLQERLQESEKFIQEMSKTWEEKLNETEKIHQERQQALQNMGISVETSGIKVESERCYMVNLNADPSLNELLVYYLKDHMQVGSDIASQTDIQLKGLGILAEHCTIDVENGNEVYITPAKGSRTCINGSLINGKTRARNGDRILWGYHHLFRLSVPRKDSMTASTDGLEELHVDYEFAQQEIMMQNHDPIQESIEAIERQYENDKQAALDAQRDMYESQMDTLKSQLVASPGTPVPWNHHLVTSPANGSVNDRLQRRIQQKAQERNNTFKTGLSKLKEELVKANIYVREANGLALELSMDVTFNVTMQIPACNLSPNRRSSISVSEPAIFAHNKQNKSQVYTMEEFDNQLVLMREMYQEFTEKGPLCPMMADIEQNPFSINGTNHDLIGVANVFLDALFYDVKLSYHVAIINQQGEVAGRLHVELVRLEGSLNDSMGDVSSIGSDDCNNASTREITVKLSIKEAKGLPPALSNFVFCQYTFYGQNDLIVVAPKVDVSQEVSVATACYRFDHEREFVVPITEEFTEHLYDGALSIEVYGHPSEEGLVHTGRSLADCWSEVTRKLDLLVEIQELNDVGYYQPVEVQAKPDIYCGGVFQLRQGYSRRILVRTRPVTESGSLPLTVDSITGVSIGGLSIRSPAHKGLDSYQDEGLVLLQTRWNQALEKRKEYLDEKMQVLAAKQEKTEQDIEREKNLMTQWLALAEERNNVLLPQPGSGMPGAPAEGEREFGIEHHSPVTFLDLDVEEMATKQKEPEPIGESALLDKEIGTTFLILPIVQNDNVVPYIIASWDSSIHDSIHLNQATPADRRVYLIVKVYIRLKNPAPVDITLRKRICVNLYKKQSLTEKLRKKISKTANTMGASYSAVGRLLHVQNSLTTCGVTYEIVSNIPKASEELEDRETMAKLAATGYESHASFDGESYIEKYIKSVAGVESIIILDRLGQEVAIKDSLLAAGRTPIRTNSSPNISGAMKTSESTPSFTNKYMISPLMKISGSFHDISKHVMKPRSSVDDVCSEPAKPVLLDEGKSTKAESLRMDPTSTENGITPSENDRSSHQSESAADSRKILNFSDMATSQETKLATQLDSPLQPSEGNGVLNIEVATISDNIIESNYENSQNKSNNAFQDNKQSSQIQLTVNEEDQEDVEENDVTPRNTPLNSLKHIKAPLASQESDSAADTSTESTPVRKMLVVHAEERLKESDELLVTECVTTGSSELFSAVMKTDSLLLQNESLTESGVVMSGDTNEEYVDSEDEENAALAVSEGRSRADMLNDIYSVNALDDLEALGEGDSMESLNSSCSADEPELVLKVNTKASRSGPQLIADNDDSDNETDEGSSKCSFGSQADLSELNNSPLPSWIEVGSPAIVLSTKGDQPMTGYIHYIGDTAFATGTWIGIQLDTPTGKNNGSVRGVSYFDCKPNHGVFVRHDRLLPDKKRSKKSMQQKEINLPISLATSSKPSFMKPTQSSKSRKK